jgi:hypothetical protein
MVFSRFAAFLTNLGIARCGACLPGVAAYAAPSDSAGLQQNSEVNAQIDATIFLTFSFELLGAFMLLSLN